jgi:hypothetical protein
MTESKKQSKEQSIPDVGGNSKPGPTGSDAGGGSQVNVPQLPPIDRLSSLIAKLDSINSKISNYDPALREHAARILVAALTENERRIPFPAGHSGEHPDMGATAGVHESSPGRSIPWINSFADLVELWKPETQSEWALLAAFYKTKVDEEETLSAQTLNTVLKHHGNGILNITRAIDDLVHASPALMLQIKKSGTTRQARKSYRLTTQGAKFVEAKLRNENMLAALVKSGVR